MPRYQGTAGFEEQSLNGRKRKRERERERGGGGGGEREGERKSARERERPIRMGTFVKKKRALS